MTTSRPSIRHDAQRLIRYRDDFTASALRGVTGSLGYGRLPEEWRATFDKNQRDHRIVYSVYSYGTPIAWMLSDGTVHMPDVNYSVTTSRHQNIVRVAWDLPRDRENQHGGSTIAEASGIPS